MVNRHSTVRTRGRKTGAVFRATGARGEEATVSPPQDPESAGVACWSRESRTSVAIPLLARRLEPLEPLAAVHTGAHRICPSTVRTRYNTSNHGPEVHRM